MRSEAKQVESVVCDILVIGSGVAGLSFCLKMADTHTICLIAKGDLRDTNTAMAQGGIASVMANEDLFENHIKDTLIAGAGLCRQEIVEKVVYEGPNRIHELEEWGVKFDSEVRPEHQDRNLTREAGHSHRRILHVQDHTGVAIQQALMAKVLAHPNIHIEEHVIAIDLLTRQQMNPFTTGSNQCLGAQFFDIKNHRFFSVIAGVTYLATGGAGKVYLYTSNWEGATGDGIAMAYRAGCRVANMEFMQFHPTCLYHPTNRNFLISEALRGEGAELINNQGTAFTYDYHKAGPLAPRDVVARAIDAEMKKTGAECVYLDIRHMGAEFIAQHFPFINDRCLSLGYDLSKDPLPVVPAAHYLCGGIVTDEFGQTDLPGLFAVGECAYTGLHGANRLASNSLLECLAFAHFASEYIRSNPTKLEIPKDIVFDSGLRLHKENPDELMLITHLWDEIRTCMWNYVGIVRSNKRLDLALTRIRNIELEINDYFKNYQVHSDIIELRNLAAVAKITILSAIQRKASVGIHFNVDLPQADAGQEPLMNVVSNNTYEPI